MNIRPAQLETDLTSIHHLCNACEPGFPTHLETVRAWFKPPPPGQIVMRLVAFEPGNSLVGYACAIHAAEAPAGYFYAWIGVDPANRRCGIGQALWEAILAFMRAQGATHLSGELLDNDPPSLSFARKQGFTIDRQRFHSILDLATFDETPFLTILESLAAQGIRFCPLSAFPDTPENYHKYMELNKAVVMDIPGEYWDFSAYPDFFDRHIAGAPWFRREGQILAVDGEIWAGFASVGLHPEARSAYNATTGVIRAYRGRHIAQALKILAARYARQQGATSISTDNDSLNAPMLAVNRNLGYQPQPGHFVLARELG